MGRGWGRRGRRSSYYESYYPRQATVAERQAQAASEVKKLARGGRDLRPVCIEGRTIARTFWGKAWCTNLEAYSDYSNRLPRGRSYVCNGLVLDLRIDPGEVTALVSGTRLYTVKIAIAELPRERWRSVVEQCAGEIGSVIELLQGKLSRSVMEIITRKDEGLFPAPREIRLSCTCPDWATMCKHVAATLYGVGARLDEEPALLFRLRQVDEGELIRSAGDLTFLDGADGAIAEDDITDIFGIELDGTAEQDAPAPASPPKRSRKPARTQAEPIEKPRRGRSKAVSTVEKKRAPGKGRHKPLVPPVGERVTARDLVGSGVPHSTIQGWLRSGVLEHSGERGIYLTTARTEGEVRSFLSSAPKPQSQARPARNTRSRAGAARKVRR